jgi:photosystem II stability/assembly factor-like uncharacterized protein
MSAIRACHREGTMSVSPCVFVLVTVVAAGCSGQATSTATTVRTPATPRVQPRLWPQGVAFWNSRDGVMVGYWSKRKCGAELCRPVIETTTDGGRGWTVRAHTDRQLTAVTVVPGGRLVASVLRGGLLVSGDAGRTLHSLTHRRVSNPSFSTARAGWALTGPAGRPREPVATTADGGQTWRTLPDPCPAVTPLADAVSAITRSIAYVLCGTGNGATNMEPKSIVRTDDGGATWSVVDAVPLPGQTAPAPANGLAIVGDNPRMVILPDLHGWLWADRGALYRTDDTKHWRAIGHSEVQPDAITVVSADLISPMSGYMLVWQNSSTHLVRTTDGGARWTSLHAWPG